MSELDVTEHGEYVSSTQGPNTDAGGFYKRTPPPAERGNFKPPLEPSTKSSSTGNTLPGLRGVAPEPEPELSSAPIALVVGAAVVVGLAVASAAMAAFFLL